MASPPNNISSRARKDNSRVERKRLADKLAQRASRERTKNRIATLEQQLASLQSGDKESEIARLTTGITRLQDDNTRLQSTLVKLRTSINETLDNIEVKDQQPYFCGPGPEAKLRTSSATSKQCRCDSSELCTCGDSPNVAFDITKPIQTAQSVSDNGSESPDVVDHEQLEFTGDPLDFAGLTVLSEVDTQSVLDLLSWPHSQAPSQPSPTILHFPSFGTSPTVARDEEKWSISNNAFQRCVKVSLPIANSACMSLHVPYKAAIFGWDTVGFETEQHPVWSSLKQVDQRVFGSWTSKAQRFALMYICAKLIQYRVHPTKQNLEQVPGFFRPRPSQERIQHPVVIDFLIWPGLRDRLVFEHQKYERDAQFNADFVRYYNFYWPYSDEQIFTFDPLQGRYEVSKLFQEYAFDLKNWTMRPGFFKRFPEMQHDIPMFDERLDYGRVPWTG